MEKIISTTSLVKEIKEMRNNIIEQITNLMKKHNVSEIYCNYISNQPTIFSGISIDEDLTLEEIEFVKTKHKDYILFNSTNRSINPKDMDIELLIEVYNWIMDYEDELFEIPKKFEDLTIEELWDLRTQIVLNSHFIADYYNSYNFNEQDVCTFFNGYYEYLFEKCEDNNVETTHENAMKYDNKISLQQWFDCFDDLSWVKRIV